MSITKSQRKKLVPNSFLYQRIISWVDIIYNQGVLSTSRPGSGDHISCCCHTFLRRFDFSANRYTHPLLTSPHHQMGSWGLAERDPCCLNPSPARRHTTYSMAAELIQQSPPPLLSQWVLFCIYTRFVIITCISLLRALLLPVFTTVCFSSGGFSQSKLHGGPGLLQFCESGCSQTWSRASEENHTSEDCSFIYQ